MQLNVSLVFLQVRSRPLVNCLIPRDTQRTEKFCLVKSYASSNKSHQENISEKKARFAHETDVREKSQCSLPFIPGSFWAASLTPFLFVLDFPVTKSLEFVLCAWKAQLSCRGKKRGNYARIYQTIVFYTFFQFLVTCFFWGKGSEKLRKTSEFRQECMILLFQCLTSSALRQNNFIFAKNTFSSGH